MEQLNYGLYDNRRKPARLIARFRDKYHAFEYHKIVTARFICWDEENHSYTAENPVAYLVDLEEERGRELSKPLITAEDIAGIECDTIAVGITYQPRYNGVDVSIKASFQGSAPECLLDCRAGLAEDLDDRLHEEVTTNNGYVDGFVVASIFSKELLESKNFVYPACGYSIDFTQSYECAIGTDS